MARNHADDVGSETTPLIIPSSPGGEPLAAPLSASTTKSTQQRKSLGIVTTCILLIILLELGAYLATIPLNQVLEEIICRNLDPHLPPDTDEPRCKDKAVQAELSIVRGWQSTLDFIPGLFTAVPYGFLADRQGRALPDLFPHRLTWLSAIFTIIGGGPAVFNAMVFTIASDVVEASQRSTIFSYLAAAVVGGELLASPLVYFLMGLDVWLSIYVGLGCLVLSIVASLLLSVRAFFNLVLLTVLIPSGSYLLIHKWSKSPQFTNLSLARASALLLTVGAFVIGLSDTSATMVFGLGVFALGSGYNILIRSLLASIVEKDNIGMLYTMMSIAETPNKVGEAQR
ncbi:hypothetical protein COL922a_007618 [Colletotrichum nupharicola]|nr:hypothetical protein COL922a_007618 [Colletotrichum nupharicola]